MYLTVFLVTIIAFLWQYFKRVYSRFTKYGVKQFDPTPPLGNIATVLFRSSHLADDLDQLYHAFPVERFVGRFEFMIPIVILRDLELIKQITLKDFDSFMDHRSIVDENADKFFGRTLFALKGQEWKDMRSTLSPAFTSSKMRVMVQFMMEAGNHMIDRLKEKICDSKENYLDIDTKDLARRYANDIVASCVFGLKVNSQADVDNQFFKMGMQLGSSFDYRQLWTLFVMANFPKLSTALELQLFTDEKKKFFIDLLMTTMNHREANKIIRPDVIQLLMEAKKGRILLDENATKNTDAGFATAEDSVFERKKIDREWSHTDLCAQTMLFFIANFEGLSSVMCFVLHELAMNPDTQNKLVKEIKENDLKNNGNFDYTSIQNMKYLDMVVSEALRLWPVGIILDRKCTKDYNLGKPNSKSTEDYYIRKGEIVMVPVWAIHHDPAYYPDPLRFDPERFSDENKHKINPFTYMPFGMGPRNCIGSRFVLCEVKVMLYLLLKHMDVTPNEKTRIPAKLSKETFNLRMEGGHWLRLKLRK